jgi:uncharacterized protein YdaU (DUF1376 family)
MRKSIKQEASPAFQFYASDWISDPNRLMMSLEEQGAYILLYSHCWRGHTIPTDMEVLARMCNCSLDKINKIFPKIKHLFEKKDGYLICLQAEEERREQAINRKRKSLAGKKGAKKRWEMNE